MSWLDELRRELDAVGIRGRSRRRIVAELADHLACDPASKDRLGSPGEIAARFAAELGVVRTRRSAYASFAALTLTALGFIATTAAMNAAGGRSGGGGIASHVPIGGIVVFFLPQLAFVAGVLGLARALVIRREGAPAPGELRLVQRRMTVAVAAAAVSTIAFAGQSIALNASAESGFSTWWVFFAVISAGLSFVALAAAGTTLRSASVVTAAGGPPARGLAADVPGPFRPLVSRLAARPLLLALSVGVPAVVLMLLGGTAVEGAWSEGVVRAALEAVAFFGCFAAFGRMLGLRR